MNGKDDRAAGPCPSVLLNLLHRMTLRMSIIAAARRGRRTPADESARSPRSGRRDSCSPAARCRAWGGVRSGSSVGRGRGEGPGEAVDGRSEQGPGLGHHLQAPEGGQLADLLDARDVLQQAVAVGHQEGLAALALQGRVERDRVESDPDQTTADSRQQRESRP